MFRTVSRYTTRSRALRTLGRVLAPGTAGGDHRHNAPRLSAREIDKLSKRIILPSLPVSDEERARVTHENDGRKLARQDRWGDLSHRIRRADACRLTTPGGETAALLLALGARSDVLAAAEDALHDGAVPDPQGMTDLEEVLQEQPGDYPCALIVALAHIDIAWAWHNLAFGRAPEQSLTQAQHHLARAEEILAPHDGIALDAPSLLAAKCALNAADESRAHKIAGDYGALITLDPESHRHMRSLGRHLLPHLDALPNGLEIEARQTAVRTRHTWCAGGYAWVYLDALRSAPAALELLDADFFIEGMEDIVARRPDQHIVNLLAAFCAITMAPDTGTATLSPRADATRARLHERLDWLVCHHLQELHPLIWAQALLAPDQTFMLPPRQTLVARGRQTALRIIAARLAGEMADGSSIAFSPHGMYHLPAL